MASLFERFRPKVWGEIVGQEKALTKITKLRERGGLAGRAYWISGASGTGKTTIAKLIAAECADSVMEIDGGELGAEMLEILARECRLRPLGLGFALVVNESHGLRSGAIRRLLVLLESLPRWVTVIFTTTAEGQEAILEDQADAQPLLSRCLVLALARRDLAKPFAERARQIAQSEGLDGQPIEKYVKLLQDCRNNLRMALGRIEAGEMETG